MTMCAVAREVAGHPVTEDGRYFAVRGRLWRMANPALGEAERAALTRQLMDARRRLRRDAPHDGRAQARADVDAAKTALGERGPAWWGDGAPDYNRKLANNTPYAQWHARLGVASKSQPAGGPLTPTRTA